MAQKKAHEVERFLTQKNADFPIVLIYGPDKGLVSERAHKFAKTTGIALNDPFSTFRLDANEIDADPARLHDEARTVSLFGSERLIWIKNAAGHKGLANAIKQVSKAPPPHCFIIIEAGDLKKGAGLRTTIESAKTAMALPCFNDDAKSLDGLIDEVTDQFQLKISLDARKWLRESLGGDRLASRGELEKLCLYALKNGEITLDDVIQSISNVTALSQDDIIDAVLLGNMQAFNDHFNKQAAANTPLFLLLYSMQRQFQQLQMLRYQVECQGETIFSAVAAAKPPIFFKRKKIIERALTYWSLSRIDYAMERLQKTVLESRKTAQLGQAIVRQTLMALTVEAARAIRRQ